MKKFLTVLLVLSLLIFTLIGCSSGPGKTIVDAGEDEISEKNESDSVKLGLGTITSIAKSKDADNDGSLAAGQVDTVIVAATFNEDDQIVNVTIDTAQTKVDFDEDLKILNDKNAEIKTKVELGDAYGMGKVSSIGKEWFEQIEELEKWMVGKTVDQIKSLSTDDGIADLTSSVTMVVEDYILGLEKAHKNSIEINAGDKLGLGHNVSIAKSKDYSIESDGDETLPLAQVDTVIAATAFDKDGKVVGTIIDTAQTVINFDAEGKVTTDKNSEFKTKTELKDAYGMGKVSSIGKEWFEQIAELEKWMLGKTIDQIKSLATDDGIADLTSSVTMVVEDYISAVEEAFTNAK